jgi:hypothetical protein
MRSFAPSDVWNKPIDEDLSIPYSQGNQLEATSHIYGHTTINVAVN